MTAEADNVTDDGKPPEHLDLFISYAGPDRPWAQWAAAQLEAAGYTLILDVWDWATGDNLVLQINDALERTDRVLTLWSPAYFERERFTTPEWTAVLADQTRRLIPIRVADCVRPAIVKALIYRDVFGLDEVAARAELLAAVAGHTGRGKHTPFPGHPSVEVRAGTTSPRLPGTIPPVWNLPARNPSFTGREGMLAGLRNLLARRGRTLVQALNGLGGVGKTQLAVEYAYLFAGEYEWAWWIDAERPELIGDQIAALAAAAGWSPADAVAGQSVTAAVTRLNTSGGWLLVFDNVTEPGHLDGWLPRGSGHVVITSRHHGFTGIAAPVPVQKFTRAESIALLHTHLPALSDEEADALAQAVGDLPLALAQTAGLLAETAMTVPEYLTELSAHAQEVLAESKPPNYPVSLAAAIEISMTQLESTDPPGAQVLQVASVLAPDPIPLDWFRTADPSVIGEDLAVVTARPLAFRRALARVADLGLCQLTGEALQVHRLTQAVLRDRYPPSELTEIRGRAGRLLASAHPGNDGTDPSSWPAWARLLPHLLRLDPSTESASLGRIAIDVIFYLVVRGEYHTALPFARAWSSHWLDHEGPDGATTLALASNLAMVYRQLGHFEQAYALDLDAFDRYSRIRGRDDRSTLVSASCLADDLTWLGRDQEAHDLDLDTLTRRRRLLGEDHPATLLAANCLAVDLGRLGRLQEAYDLDQETLNHHRRLLGDDHPNTLISALNLAVDLGRLDRFQQACDLEENTLVRARRVLGDDHPNTLMLESNYAEHLRALGREQEAHDLDRDTLVRRRRVLDEDHPDTLISALNLAIDLGRLGRHQEACDLEQDTLTRARRVLGDDHPNTLTLESNYAEHLRALSRMQEG